MKPCNCEELIVEHQDEVKYWMKLWQCKRCFTWHYVVPFKGVAHFSNNLMARSKDRIEIVRIAVQQLMKKPTHNYIPERTIQAAREEQKLREQEPRRPSEIESIEESPKADQSNSHS